MEQYVKNKQLENNLHIMQAELKNALKKVKRAQKFAKNTALCCEASIDDLVNELVRQIEIVKKHTKDGLLERDIV